MLPLHALFQRRFDGDDALLRLARRRFAQAGLAAEVYAGNPAELEWILPFTPDDVPLPTVHLSRGIDLLTTDGQERVSLLARRFGHRVGGFVVHDQAHMPGRLEELTAAADRLSATLVASGGARLFIEYAAGVAPEAFVTVGEALRDVERVSMCLDTGHVGIRQARHEFARRRPDVDRDLAALDVTDPDLPDLVDDVTAAVSSGLAVLLDLTTSLAALGKPVHFHLHDGHPLVRGLSDHFGFLMRLPIPFRHDGLASLGPLFGVRGLRRIMETISELLGPGQSSLTLEIHQLRGRLPLPEEDVEQLFPHWRDLSHAEWMNGWLRELAENAVLARAFGPAD